MTGAHEIILFVKRVEVGHRKRVVGNWIGDRAPDVNDSNPRFEEAVGFFTEMMVHPGDTRGICLVDVNTFLIVCMSPIIPFILNHTHNRAASHWAIRVVVSSDGVIEDKDPLCPSLLLQ